MPCPPPSDHKKCKANQAVLTKAKLAFHEYWGLVLDFDFSVKNHSSLRPLATQESVASVVQGRSQGAKSPKLFCWSLYNYFVFVNLTLFAVC